MALNMYWNESHSVLWHILVGVTIIMFLVKGQPEEGQPEEGQLEEGQSEEGQP